ncbi:metallophosphoesterase [Pseudooceanicola sp.]|uniref:metallophosphoesterase n=1 Tax=Pseudooceanicola sp. TaxID=1914328 RepID=UPI0026348B7F|nr:metallophosphoesterase [Pseudooceanicola sp.]
MPIYVIPDIHGHRAMLEQALRRIASDGATDADEVIFLGDFIDRGPDSRGVIEILSQGREAGRNWSFLMGNHDRMMRRYLLDGTATDAAVKSGIPWTHNRFGGAAFRSYGVDPTAAQSPEALHAALVAAVPRSHVDFLATLSLTLIRDELLFVHAGIRPGIALADQSEDDLVWIRGEFLNHPDPHPWLVVHGHTALPAPRHFGNHIDLDGGAGMGRELFPAVFEDGICHMLTAEGRQILPVTPLAPDEPAPWA